MKCQYQKCCSYGAYDEKIAGANKIQKHWMNMSPASVWSVIASLPFAV